MDIFQGLLLLFSLAIPLCYNLFGYIPIYLCDIILTGILFRKFLIRCLSGLTVFKLNLLETETLSLFLFIIWLIISALVKHHNVFTIQATLNWFKVFVFFIYFKNSYIQQKKFFQFWIALFIIESLICIVQILTHSPFGALNQYFGEKGGIHNIAGYYYQFFRVTGTFNDPGILGVWLCFLVPYTINSFLKSTKFSFVYLFILVLEILILILTYTRSAWFAVFISFSVYMFKSKFSFKKFLYYFITSLIIFVVIVVINVKTGGAIWYRIHLTDPSVIRRLEYIFLGWEVFKRNIFWGTGLWNFIPVADDLGLLNLYHTWGGTYITSSVHSLFLRMSAETGIIGVTLFIAWIYVLFKKILQSKDAIIFSGFMGFITFAIVNMCSRYLVWILIVLIVSLKNKSL